MTDQTNPTQPSMVPVLNVLQRINAVQKEVAYIQKDRSVSTGANGPSYRAVSHDAVTAMLRPHLIKHGIVYTTTLADECHFDTKEEGSKQRLFRATFTICFASIDKPEDRIFVTLPAHALDNGDKAPGKAISYATKYALLKVFALETGEDEESRYKSDDYDFAAVLEMAENATEQDALTLLTEAKAAAMRLKDPAAAKAIATVAKRLGEKFKKGDKQ
jgi:hypothetical protein